MLVRRQAVRRHSRPNHCGNQIWIEIMIKQIEAEEARPCKTKCNAIFHALRRHSRSRIREKKFDSH